MSPGDRDDMRLRTEYAARERRLAHSDLYSLFNPGNLYLVQGRQRAVLQLLRREGCSTLSEKRLLEVGCGAGMVLLEFLSYGATPGRLHGVDLLDWRLADGRVRLAGVPLMQADGRSLPYEDAAFDVVMQFTMFSSILDGAVRQAAAHEMRRVLRPNGLILWYDYWLNPTNRQTRGIRPAEVRRLFPDCRTTFQRVTLAPPLARRLARRAWLLCSVLESLRVLNTHYLVAVRPNQP
ncbi:MAG TPA: class I SAM-dependent methyltransferase [Chloroflexia bacterium]|nr:class I SAM-dependent methyltransferase [Chloroflexia bacterium]